MIKPEGERQHRLTGFDLVCMEAWSSSLLKIQNVFPIFFLHLHGYQDFASQTIGRDDNILMMSSKFGKVFKNENMKGYACFLEICNTKKTQSC